MDCLKWKNKGHEFDAMYDQIRQKRKYYMFGAGDYGQQFFHLMKDEIQLEGYIDHDPDKNGKRVNNLVCQPLSEMHPAKDTGIIVTMSQIARTSALEQLHAKGFVRNRDYFLIDEFISVYYAYKHQQVWFSNISFLPSTACNLNCRYCLNFNPFSEKFYVRELSHLKSDVDLFFQCVDHIMLFHVSGGETFLYPHIGDIVSYIHDNYGDRIDTLRMVTNGTIVPKDNVLEKISSANVEITVDDYRDALPGTEEKFEHLLSKLQEYKIKYYVNKVDGWIDLGPDVTDYSNWPEEKLILHRDMCNQNWQELRDGKLYSCNYAAYAVVTGKLGGQDLEETYDLKTFSKDKAKELIEFRLGYSEKGYTNFCKYCRGFSPQNTTVVAPAMQTNVKNLEFVCKNKQ